MGYVLNRGTKDRPMWYCKYRGLDGKWKQKATKQTTKAAALRFVAEIEARIARGQIGVPELTEQEQTAKTLTVGDLAQRFLQEYNSPRLKDRAAYMSNAAPWVRRRLLPYPLAGLPVLEVKRLHVAQYRDALRKQGFEPSTVNTSLRYISRVFSWAIETEIVDCRNPVSKVESLRTIPSEQCYTREQCARLLSPDCNPKIATALHTGMRPGELCGLRWSDVRFDLNIIEIRRSYRTTPKNSKARTIPLHSDLAPILRAWQVKCPATPEGLVFPECGAEGVYRMAIRQDAVKVRQILVAAGCPGDHDRPLHAMRHTFITLLAESHASPEAITRIVGHSGGGNRVTAGYTHVSAEFLRSELEKLRLMPGQPANVLRIADYRQPA